MIPKYTLQNGKGEVVQVDSQFRTLVNGKMSVIDEGSFHSIMNSKYGADYELSSLKWAKSLSLNNANGDIASSSLGYNYLVDKMAYIRSAIIEQTFFEVAPSEYVDIMVGEGAWASDIVTNLTIQSGSKFEDGNIKTGGHTARQNVADASVVPFHMPVMTWQFGSEWTIADVQMAALSGNWNVIEMKHRARKKIYDLGIQKVAFLGLAENLDDFPGLYTQPNVNSNTSLITEKLSGMTAAELNTVAAGMVEAFRSNCNRTAWPTDWLVPEDDFLGLASQMSETYPMRTKLEVLEIAFKGMIPGGKAQIRPMSYGMPDHNKNYINVGTGYTRHIVYKRDPESVLMEIPVDFFVTAPGTFNNFNFQDAGVAQYSGVGAFKPLEMLYFDF